MANVPINPERLAAAVAARLVHDAMGPASGIVSAFELIADPAAAAVRDEALALAAASAGALVAQLAVSRIIHATGDVVLPSAELASLAQSIFNGARARLELDIHPATSPRAGRALLGLLRVLAGGVAAGGVVKAGVTSNETAEVCRVEARGPRFRMDDETLAGLAGEDLVSGLAPRWAPAYFLSAVAASSGGEVGFERLNDGIVCQAVFPL